MRRPAQRGWMTFSRSSGYWVKIWAQIFLPSSCPFQHAKSTRFLLTWCGQHYSVEGWLFFSRLVFFIKQPLIPRYKRKLSPSEIQHQISACLGEWGGRRGPHTNKQLSNTSRAPYNSTQSCHYLPRDIIRFHRLKTQSYKTMILLPER